VHHQKGYHKNNYSDLPLWDMIFGTFENPRNQVNDCGFSSDKELDLMGLIFPGLRRTAKGVINENSSNN
jgi:sterol desaturase/sphingolipid hydroxylase (fatty acid hydroxylase superfamily)